MDKDIIDDDISGISVNSFYIPSHKSENYSNIIKIVKNDLLKTQDMINSIGDIPFNQLKTKNPKIFEIEETRDINAFIDKVQILIKFMIYMEQIIQKIVLKNYILNVVYMIY